MENIKEIQFDTNTKDKILEILSRHNFKNELEFRIGEFKWINNKSIFESNNEIDYFYRLKNLLTEYGICHKKYNTIEKIYNEINYNVKEIYNKDDKTTIYQQKKKIYTYNIYDFNIRIAISKENIIPQYKGKNEYVLREKERYSFDLNYCNIDLTKVKQDNKMMFEIELELKEKINIDILNKILSLILFTKDLSQNIITTTEKNKIINEYKQIFNTGFFVGAQPETLQKHLIHELGKIEYAITDKADGDRYILFISSDKTVYFIDNNIKKVLKTDIKSNLYYSTVIDGELIKKNDKFLFLAFDIIAFNNKDLRGDNTQYLKTRLNRLNHIIETINNNCEDKYFEIKMKKYYYKNIFLGAKKIMDDIVNKDYENDGLIYTPMNECYPVNKKWKMLLKWKPSEMNTIDFYAVKDVNSNIWNLYVQHYNSKNPKSCVNELVLFDVNKLCENNKTDTKTFITYISKDLIDPITKEPYETNTVIEFKWDKSKNMWIPLRTRWDKTYNVNKFGNFSSVACNIWNSIHNPVKLEDLFLYVKRTQNNQDENNFFFKTMRNFHNNIKRNLYDKYLKNTNNLLELASGKCGDLHKWINSNIQNVDGFDYCYNSLQECKKRIDGVDKKLHDRFKFYNVDLTSNNLNIDIFENDKYDNASCHFAIHYFLKSKQTFENLFKILNKSLKKDGLFICTFIDDKELYKLFNNNSSKCYELNNEIIYYLKRYDFSNPEYNNKFDIYLNGQNYLSTGSNEFIINYEKFIKNFENNGFELIESKLFKELDNNTYNMTEYEKDISYLNRYCVFRSRKIDNNTNKCILIEQNDSDEQNENIKYINKQDIYYINVDNIKLGMYKINTLNDINVIIKCTENDYKIQVNNDDIITDEKLDIIFGSDLGFININLNTNITEELLKEELLKLNDKNVIFLKVSDKNINRQVEIITYYWVTFNEHIFRNNNILTNKKQNMKEFPILYKKDRQWKIKVIDNIIETEYGQKKMTKTKTIVSGKNKGKKNETTDYEQAVKEAEKKWNSKKEEGYTENKETVKNEELIENDIKDSVMLAKVFEEKKITFPCYVQPKLDGYRMFWTNGKMYSRTGKEFTTLIKLKEELKNINYKLDGELYVHGMMFESYGVLRKQKITKKDEEILNKIEYHVYDIIDDTKTFEERNNILNELKNKLTNNIIKIVPTYICNNVDEIYKYHNEFVENGYEGTIVRLNKKYEHKRTHNLMKLKDFQDDEFEIVDYTFEKKDVKGDKLVIWICKTKDGKTFNVRQSGDEAARIEYYKNGDKYKGRNLCVKFFGFTNDNIPRFPVTKSIDSIRDEKY